MRWSAIKRMEFIEARLYWEGKIGRKDLTEFFNISIPQATKDIKAYYELAPDNINYDTKAKQYVATVDFKPKFSQASSDRYLSRLQILKENRGQDYFFYGQIPPFAGLPQFRRFVDTEVLRALLKSIHRKEAIKISYQSMSAAEPKTRWITPHALGHDGLRWHVRSLCHTDNIYKDFNLGRIIKIIDSNPNDMDHSFDYEWHNEITVIIIPHRELTDGKRSCIERDYCMVDGQVSLQIKAAFFYYFQQRFGFVDDHETNKGNEQQIQLLNIDEIKAKVDLLKTMSINKLTELMHTEKYLKFTNS